MDTVCSHDDVGCEARALTAALHSLHVYCSALAAALISCCAPAHPPWYGKRVKWRGQNIRGVASLVLGVVWCCDAAVSLLRPGDRVRLVSALMGPLAWVAAAWLHIALWTRLAASPVLYLAVYWLLSAASSAAVLWQQLQAEASPVYIDVYLQTASLMLALLIAAVDCACFYDEVSKRFTNHRKTSTETSNNTGYKHNEVHFYSKVSFFWINPLLYRGYESPLEHDDLGELPDDERSAVHYNKFKKIYAEKVTSKNYDERRPSLWKSYTQMVWPNFYIAGVLKLFSDLMGVVPPLGLAVVIQFIEDPVNDVDPNKPVTVYEFFTNGYVMLLLMSLALIAQAILSQNSTHLATVEGTRLKTALQGLIFDKCMRLAPWTSSPSDFDEESPLLPHGDSEPTQTGLLTNLVSQDTYNIMSCVWICHYTWAIPLKVSLILYLLYTKLGVSAVIGTLMSIVFITPLQFYIGKKISDNSKGIAKCTDHRVSKMTEILQGMNVIKLYVWEDLFKEKILNLREVELQLLNKDSVYWNFLTFSTQVSTVLVTVITFTVYYFLSGSENLTAVNVFAGLALFNQLTVPLLILPVTVLMVIQAMVSTQRITEFLELPESNNNTEDKDKPIHSNTDKFNDAFVDNKPIDINTISSNKDESTNVDSDNFSEDEETVPRPDHVVKFRNAIFSWGLRSDASPLEVDQLDIPTGKLIMIIGPTSSGKSSFLNAVLGEMYLERGDVIWNGSQSAWYAGQPPWLLEGSVRDNIVMDSSWCPRRYARVLRATGLRPDLQLLPDGDSTLLGHRGIPLSGGQRVRVCVARALYSRTRIVALDEPLGALDGALARHVVARGFVPAARAGRTVLVATNRLELMHYADMVIVMEDGRVSSYGRAGDVALSRWSRLAAEARAAAARGGVGPPGGTARERSRLVRALSRAKFQRTTPDDSPVGINEVTGAYLLAEVSGCGRGSWRRATARPRPRPRPALARQLSSPPSSQHAKLRREVRRVVSADASNTSLQREASLIRRLLRPRANRTLARWTPRPLRRLLSSDSEAAPDENQANIGRPDDSALEATYTSLTSNGVETVPGSASNESISEKGREGHVENECSIWWSYMRACGWAGGVHWATAAGAQALAVAADFWLARTTSDNARQTLDDDQMWHSVSTYALWCIGGATLAGVAQAASGVAGATARRKLHDQLLHASLHTPLHHHHATPLGVALHRFSADVQVIDKKLPTAMSRWTQLALLCGAAILVNAAAAPWSLLALVPTLTVYLMLQTVYLRNSRELQRAEARSAAPVVSLAGEAGAGGPTIRVVRLQRRLRNKFLRRLDDNHNSLLLLNTANRWLGLSMDLVGAAAVCVSMSLAVCGGSSQSELAGLAGAHALLLPAYLAHLAKCRADLDLHLAAVERVQADINAPQEDYREDCPIPSGWQRDGKIEFENVSVQHEPGTPPTLVNVNLSIGKGEKVSVCGRSGSGKSTLLASCVGAAQVTSGRVLIDDVDATRVPLRVLRHRIVVLPQEATIFSGTLRENLDPLGVHTDQEIWQSLRVVGLHDFVTAQPAGLECSIGGPVPGCGWSAGRRARASAARAMLRAPLAAAILLDEPAAALDATGERTLLAAIANGAPNTTLVTVAHRIQSIRNYERAIVVDRGRVVEQGAPAALLSQPTSRLARMHAAALRDA